MRILVVDDEHSIREFCKIALKKANYEVTCAEDGGKACELLKKKSFDMVLSDLQMPNMSGMELLDNVNKNYPDVIFIFITAHGTISNAVHAMKKGAFDYILKPFQIDELLIKVKSAFKLKHLEQENSLLKRELQIKGGVDQLIGNSACMKPVYKIIENVSKVSTNILITGESGTGKEMVAKAIHNLSPLKDKPFVTVNCGAIPEQLIESEMFGHKKGAFTGASFDKTGLFEAASGGTLFLDEVGELPLNIQVKLLRVIQERVVRKVGAINDIKINVRILVATNKDLEQMVQQKLFREDLYYRLNVISINVPALRERLDDVPVLANIFLEKYSGKFSKNIKAISDKAMRLLGSYQYPGNVRELENIIERAVALENTKTILPESLPELTNKKPGSQNPEVTDDDLDLETIMDRLEKELLTKAMNKSNGVKSNAAKLLGITLRSLRYRLSKFELDENLNDSDMEEAS